MKAKKKNVLFKWVEAKSYADMQCPDRFVYGIVTPGSPVTVWPAVNGGSSPIARADEALTKAALLAGSRVFFACLPSHQLEQLVAMKEELKQDLERYAESLR